MSATWTGASMAASRRSRDLKKLFHLDMMAAGQYISRRIMGNLSVETSEAEAEAFCQAVEEFLVTRGDVLRAALPAAERCSELAPMILAASSMSLTMASRASVASPFLSAFEQRGDAGSGPITPLEANSCCWMVSSGPICSHSDSMILTSVGMPRAAIEAEMEFPVLRPGTPDAWSGPGSLHLVVHARHAVLISSAVMQRRRFLGRQAFERGADARDLAEPLARDDRQGDAAVGQQHQHMLRHQPAQRLAHRHQADAEGLGQAADGHGGARRDAAGHQRLLQLLVDFLVQRVALKLGHFQFELAERVLVLRSVAFAPVPSWRVM